MNGSKSRVPQRSWLISFADLLTVLLCFFLSVISFSPLNPQSAQARGAVSSGADAGKDPERKQTRRFEQGGTQLAPKLDEGARPESGPRGIRLIFLADEFSPAGDGLLADARERIENALIGADLSGTVIKIHTCSSNELENANASFERAARRSASLRRQLIDSADALRKEVFLFRNLGAGCGGLQNSPKDDAVAGIIEIEAGRHNG